MNRYNVILQIFAASGADIVVEAEDEIEAERIAREIAESRFANGALAAGTLNEICINSVEKLTTVEKSK